MSKITGAPLPPYRAARRLICPASRRLEMQAPKTTSDKKAEGVAAHETAQKILKNEAVKKGDLAKNSLEVTQEMVEGGQAYANYINAIKKTPGFTLLAEENEKLLTALSINPKIWGYPDCWVALENDKEIQVHVFEYKFGFTQVRAFENYQLLVYAAGVLDKLKPNANKTRIFIHVIQPRAIFIKNSIYDKWTLSISDFLKYRDKLKISEEKSLLPDAPAAPGEHCKHCSARAFCTALQQKSLNVAETVNEMADFSELDGNALGNELRILEESRAVINARYEALKEIAFSRVKNKENVLFYKFSETRGKTEWKKGIDKNNISETAKLFKINVFKDPALVTPLQAIKAGVPDFIIKPFMEDKKGAGKLELVNTHDLSYLFSPRAID